MPGSTTETIPFGSTNTPSAGTDKVLPKIDSSKAYSGEYMLVDTDDSIIKLFISNTFKTKSGLRNYVKLTHTVPATESTDEVISTVTVSIDGRTDETSTLDDMVQGLAAWLSTANVEKLRGGQS